MSYLKPITWQTISANKTLTINNGYNLSGSTLLELTLPTANLNIGDVIQISDSVGCQFKIKQNANQYILMDSENIPGTFNTVVSPNVSSRYGLFISNTDGSKLLAAPEPGYSDYLKLSSDFGKSWTTLTNSGNSASWYAIDGNLALTKLIAANSSLGIKVSTDSGSTWSNPLTGDYRSCASSYDGTKMVAAPASGYLQRSTNSGSSWSQLTASGSRNWTGLASSADGTIIVATAINGANFEIYQSTDSGTNWSLKYTFANSLSAAKIVCSGDGYYQYITGTATNNSYIYGTTNLWTYYYWANTDTTRAYTNISCSTSGHKVVTFTNNEINYANGANLNVNASYSFNKIYPGLYVVPKSGCLSKDGNTLFVIDSGTGGSAKAITSRTHTSIGTSGYALSSAIGFVELTYIGNNVFKITKKSVDVILI